MCDMTHSYVWHDLFIWVTWLTHICDMICATWPIHMCDMTYLYEWHNSLIYATRYVRHDSFICLTQLCKVHTSCSLALARALTLSHERERSLAFPCTISFSRVLALSLSRALSRAPTRAQAPARSHVCVLSLPPSFSLAHSLSLAPARSLSPPPPHFLSPSPSIRRMCGKRLQNLILGVLRASKSFV